MFVDQVRIFAQAGKGGSGVCSFRREKFVPKGGPDGGDGGQGGDIVLVADPHTDNLVSLYYEPLQKAKKGGNGGGAKRHGRSAPARFVKVPPGTLVYRALPPESSDDAVGKIDPDAEAPRRRRKLTTEGLELVVDLDEPGKEFLLCRGGDGGRGNVHFKSSRNRTPMQFTKGDPGEEGWFILELHTIADAGLVGYPNAGKSTLLGAISAAHPKVAAYPFTTLTPHVGIIDLPGYRRLSVADIPGLIEGAHADVGLGHEFLRHIVRCKLLVLVVDLSGLEGRQPWDDLASLRRELDLYDPRLSERPWLIAANKVELPESQENLRLLRQQFPNREIVPISALERKGVDALVETVARILEEAGEKLGPA